MTSGQVVRWACDLCQRFWPTADELKGHRCLNVTAVLEAAERVVKKWPLESCGADDLRTFCVVCDRDVTEGCAPDCAGQALVAALREQERPA